MFCPHCGSQMVDEDGSIPEDSKLFVAEDTGSSTEYFDSAQPYVCLDCNTRFYLGDE